MFCIQCGAQIEQDSKFCSSCGSPVQTGVPTEEYTEENTKAYGERETQPKTDFTRDAPAEMAAAAESTLMHATGGRQAEPGNRKSRKPLFVAGGIAAGVLVLAGAGFGLTRYMGQADLDHAATAATAGNYSLALSQALAAKRFEPYSTVIPGKIHLYQLAGQAAKDNQSGAASLKHGDYQGAIQKFTTVKNLLAGQSDSLFHNLKATSQTGIDKGKVGLIEQQAVKSSDVSQVASYLSQIHGFSKDVRVQAQTTVQSHLESLAAKAVQQDIQNDNFDAASTVVQTALQPNTGDEKITALNQMISSAKQAYEQKQQQIEEQSLAQAAQISNQNQHPVNVTSVNVTYDAYGDAVASGEIVNQATQTIGDVELTINFYDNSGDLVDTEYTYVYPAVLNSGDSGTFQVSIPSYYNATSASVVYSTWLNE